MEVISKLHAAGAALNERPRGPDFNEASIALMQQLRTADDPVRTAYTAILSRQPSSDEYHAAQTLAQRYGIADVVWSLVNTHEFLFGFRGGN